MISFGAYVFICKIAPAIACYKYFSPDKLIFFQKNYIRLCGGGVGMVDRVVGVGSVDNGILGGVGVVSCATSIGGADSCH